MYTIGVVYLIVTTIINLFQQNWRILCHQTDLLVNYGNSSKLIVSFVIISVVVNARTQNYIETNEFIDLH